MLPQDINPTELLEKMEALPLSEIAEIFTKLHGKKAYIVEGAILIENEPAPMRLDPNSSRFETQNRIRKKLQDITSA